ncbi:hypothetical protein NGRA_2540 [Nosema granulosis]|uniref:Uncharacterized protein n=1 Tax=Nosema granulosis TaxID=83296 RepID=A0A9P6GXV8_9MICR|nr:hypothetical protein NGRA_2540 [Nosema granulosis]
MNLILLIVLDKVICPRTSLPSSYIINTSDSGSNGGLNIPELRTPVDDLLCIIPQNPSDSSSNCPNVSNYQQHEIYNYPQAHPIFNAQYGTYNYSQDQNYLPQYGTNNNSPQIEDLNAHNNLLLESLSKDQISGENEADISNIIDLLEFDNYHRASNSNAHNNLEFPFRNEDQISGENEADISNIIDLLEFDNYHQASNSNAHNNLEFTFRNEDQISGENEADISNIIDLLEFDNYHQASNSNAHNNLEFTFRNEDQRSGENEADDGSIIYVVGIDDQHQASLSKKDSELFNLNKRKLKDEIITSPDGIKKQRNVKKYPPAINLVGNGLNYKKYNRTKTLKENSFLKKIENYNLPILYTQINIDLLRLSMNFKKITNTKNFQTEDNTTYVEVFKRIVYTVNLVFLSKVNEKRQTTQNMIVSEQKTSFDIFDSDIDLLRKEILEFKQDEYLILSNIMKVLESKLKHSLANPRICFYDYLKNVAHLIYNNNNFDVTIIIKNLLYEMRILKYEVREMRSVILTIIYYNNLDIKDAREFLDLFICRMFVLFKTINSIGKTESPIKYLEKTSYFISRIFYNFFYGDTERHFSDFHDHEMSIKSDIDDIIGEDNYDLPFSTTDLFIFRILGYRSSIETYNAIINLLKLINNPKKQPHFTLSNCYNFLLKLRTIGEILVPIKQNCTDLEDTSTRN